MTEQDVYQFYTEKVKILYSEIEARNNTLPVELLFEIHSAFDHLKRFHIDNESEEKCAEKAFSHLKRGMLDAFKLKLKYHNADYEKLMKQKYNGRHEAHHHYYTP
jgi:tryptophanyl-tRNA synthetase